MAIAAIFLSVGFTACSSDDDDNNNGNTPGASEAITGKFTLDFTVSEDLLNVADVNVTYTDENGRDVTETLSSTEFQKTVTYTKLPVTAKYSIKATLKSTYATKDKYNLGFNYSHKFQKLKGEKILDTKENGSGQNLNGIKAEKLSQAITQFNKDIFPKAEYQFTK